jgi:tape measure domain-containing protein
MSGITAEERKLLASLKQLQDQLNNAGSTGASAGNKIAGSFSNINDVVKALIPTLGAAFAADKLRQFALYAFETAKQFEQMGKTLAFVTGSTQKAQQQLSYMTALAQQLGLNVRALTDGFKGFAAAAAFAGVSQENINRQMVAFTKAAAALSMSAEDTKLMFTALGQMYSKNKIQAEELRVQLGERLPGSMELLAKSMKIPVTALDEMLKKGEIITKEVMPAFAKEVELAFGIAAYQTDTLTAAQNKMFTSIEIAATRLMEGGIGDFIKTLFKSVSVIFQYLNVLIKDNLQSQLDANERFRVETEKNTLLAIEQYQKQYKEKTGLEITAAEASKALLEDSKYGEAAYWTWMNDF